MLSKYADEFNMPNFRMLRDSGTNFNDAYLGYMGSETVIAHNVLMSGQNPEEHGLGRRGLPRPRGPAESRHQSDVDYR